MSTQDHPGQGKLRMAIPMSGGKFSEHFGGAREFLVFEADRSTGSLGKGALFSAPQHKPGSLPEWLASQQMDVVIVSAIGERALLMLADAGIETYLAGGESQPAALAAACLMGKLPRANQENSRCKGEHQEHDGHDCGHH